MPAIGGGDPFRLRDRVGILRAPVYGVCSLLRVPGNRLFRRSRVRSWIKVVEKIIQASASAGFAQARHARGPLTRVAAKGRDLLYFRLYGPDYKVARYTAILISFVLTQPS